MLRTVVYAFLGLLWCICSQATASGVVTGPESSQAPLVMISQFFPEADHIGAKTGSVPAQAIFKGEKLLGYVFFTDEVFPIPAYSGHPIRAIAGVDLQGTITGIQIVSHQEPILVIGVSDADLESYTDQYLTINANDRVKLGSQVREGYKNLDGITGATITTMVLHRSIMESARRAVEANNLGQFYPVSHIQEPVWKQSWQEKTWQLGILILGLIVLIGILFFQDWLIVHSRIFNVVRICYLIYTVVFIGFICLAQLSIINVLTFGGVLARGFSWDTFLVDPLIFVLWGFVATTVLLWGRGVYCGWLCPFGALQELIHKVANSINIPAFKVHPMVHERLWAVKYVILMLLLGLSLNSIGTVATFVEIEPFKTVFSLRFQREWYFVAYAVGLLLLAIVNTKFYCKYLCPLGAALSFGTRFKIFNWLRRRPDCGSVCQTCANECSVDAISVTGEIIDTECHYCLECQSSYWDEHKCPEMVKQRERRERRLSRVSIIPTTEQE